MTLLSLLFWLLAGGTLQVLMPAWRHMGQPSFPFVLGVVLYAAMAKKPRYFVAMALLGGMLEDSLSLAPLGFSTCAFLVAGGLAVLLRADFFAHKATTVSVFGALCASVSTGVMAALLHAMDLAGRHILFVLPPGGDTEFKSLRNLDGVRVLRSNELNAYSILWADQLIFTQTSLQGTEEVYA